MSAEKAPAAAVRRAAEDSKSIFRLTSTVTREFKGFARSHVDIINMLKVAKNRLHGLVSMPTILDFKPRKFVRSCFHEELESHKEV